MIEISRNAWYIKYIMTVCDYPPSNICQLMRYFMGTTLAWAIMTTVVSLFAFLVIAPGLYYYGIVENVVTMILGVMLDGWLLSMLIRELVDRKKIKNKLLTTDILPNHVPGTSFFRVLTHWFWSLHDGVCLQIKMK